jgi:NAD(P)-dependent dehydrogenase (short-subunit alcohol dehydrogenase family)
MSETELAATTPRLFDLTGRRTIVTGASRGIGRAIAVGFAECGASVLGVARSEEGLEATASLAAAATGSFEAYPADLRDPEAIEATISHAVDKLGGIDVLVNNAADDSADDVIEKVDLAGFQRVIELTLQSTWLMCRAASPHLAESEGKVVNMASMLGVIGMASDTPYIAAKHGVVGITRSLALEWARSNVQVNAIAPGFVRTEMTKALHEDERLTKWIERSTPLRRFAEPEEMVGTAVFLASPASDFITGQVILVDGGWTAQ